jgi:hypothetical protein
MTNPPNDQVRPPLRHSGFGFDSDFWFRVSELFDRRLPGASRGGLRVFRRDGGPEVEEAALHVG